MQIFKFRVELEVGRLTTFLFFKIYKMILKRYCSYFYEVENHWLKTFRCYLRYIRTFDLFLRNKGKNLEHPELIDYSDVESFVKHLREKWCCANTCNSYLFWIKSFFKFCYFHDIKSLDYLKIIFAKKEKVKVEACCEEDIRKLITSIKTTNYIYRYFIFRR